MKKFLSLILALAMVACMSVTAFAADGTTVLTVEVPDNTPSYTFHCKASVSLEYGNTDYQEVDDVYATDVVLNGFTGSRIRLFAEAKYTDLINTDDSTDTIDLGLYHMARVMGEEVYSLIDPTTGDSGCSQDVYDSNWVNTYFSLYAKVDNWNSATPGATYNATITYIVTPYVYN